ncbi:MAG: hypothetical protein QOD69_1467 [Solirubrobacteraceae bacterium]|nr:hypothetical protein [Solirubrobacteraceae bacterium]
MGLIDDLGAGLHAAERALSALGPRPSGDAAALAALARAARQEADAAASLGRLEASIAATMVFVGPAARQFAGNADEVADALFTTQRMLDAAADAIEHAARAIAHAQAEHDRARNGLLGQIEELGRKLPHIPL